MTALIGCYILSVVIAFFVWLGWALGEWPDGRDTPEKKREAARILRTWWLALVWPMPLALWIHDVLRDGEGEDGKA